LLTDDPYPALAPETEAHPKDLESSAEAIAKSETAVRSGRM